MFRWDAVCLIGYRFHCQTGCLLQAEEEVHGVDCIAGASFEEIVDNGCDEEFAVNLIEMDYTLVGVDHVFQVRNLGGYESEIVVSVIFIVYLYYFRKVERTVEIADSHDSA